MDQNLLLSNNVSFKLISQNQKVQNDKERIKSKFNFNISRTSTNSSAIKQSSLTTQQNSCIFSDKIQKIKNKIIHQNNNKLSNKNTSPNTTQKAKKTIKIINDSTNNKQSNEYIKINSKRNNDNKESSMCPSNIINNIINSNISDFDNNESSSLVSDNKKKHLLVLENNLKTLSLEEGINRCNSNNTNSCICSDKTNSNLKLNKISENVEETKTLKENEILKSFNNTSFSASSKTSELNRNNLCLGENLSNNENNIRIMNNNNYIIRNYIGLNNKNYNNNNNNNKNINNGENFLQEIFKPYKKFNYERKRTEVSSNLLLDDDDYNKENRQKMMKNVSHYYFIDYINEKNNNIIFLSFEKFQKIQNNAKYKIFSFIFDNYKNLLNTSKSMRNIIIKMLEEKFGNCIKDFKKRYQNILLLDSYNFNLYKYYHQQIMNKKYSKFCLYLKAKILPNNLFLNKYGDIGLEISYNYKIKTLKSEKNNIKSNRTNVTLNSNISKDHIKEEYTQIYKFDLRKNKNYPMWFFCERDDYNNSLKNGSMMAKILKKDCLYQSHLIYSTPIINVNENDYIIFKIDLIEDNKIIENIRFNNIIIESINKNYFHKSSYKPEQKYDNMRDCETEIVINIWHDVDVIKDYCTIEASQIYEKLIEKIKTSFQEYFEIIDTKFDISKLFFIRLTMKAKKIGILKKNEFSNKNIEIVEKNTILTKECIPINLVNAFSMNKTLAIKQDTIVDFYFME